MTQVALLRRVAQHPSHSSITVATAAFLVSLKVVVMLMSDL